MEINKTWTQFKELTKVKEFSVQYFQKLDTYHIFASEGGQYYFTNIKINDPANDDQSDFETNYKPFANQPVSPEPVREYLSGVQGYYQNRGEKLTIPANSSNILDITWPFNIRLGSMLFYPANTGDKVEGMVNPDTTVGALTANASIGDTVLNVSPTVIQYINPGFRYRITDGVNEDRGIVCGVNAIAGTITLHTELAHDYSAASPTYVQMSISMAYEPIELSDKWICSCGEKVLGGSLVPEGTVFRIRYWNNSSSEVTVYFKFEYWY